MKYYKLNVDAINDDFFEDTKLLGIITPLKRFQLCWQVNSRFGFKFSMSKDKELKLEKHKRTYFYSLFISNEPNSQLKHVLYHNQFDGEYLLNEFKHIDYLWLMKGDMIEEERYNWIKDALKTIDGVQLVAELTNEQIKTKGNLIFDF